MTGASATLPARSLDHLAGFLRVIRVPRADIRAMVDRAPAGTDAAMAAIDAVDATLAAHGWVAESVDPGVRIAAAAAFDAGETTRGDALLAGWWCAEPTRLDALANGVRRLYLGSSGAPDCTLAVIAGGRAALIDEAVAGFRDGRHASAVALTITQIDGIAADVPPTPGAALPFLVDDPRDHDAVTGAALDAATLAAHPGSLAAVERLMRTSRPDTGPTTAVHRHGIMHGRDLGFGTPANAARVFALLGTLLAWATPVADARRGPAATSVVDAPRAQPTPRLLP